MELIYYMYMERICVSQYVFSLMDRLFEKGEMAKCCFVSTKKLKKPAEKNKTY